MHQGKTEDFFRSMRDLDERQLRLNDARAALFARYVGPDGGEGMSQVLGWISLRLRRLWLTRGSAGGGGPPLHAAVDPDVGQGSPRLAAGDGAVASPGRLGRRGPAAVGRPGVGPSGRRLRARDRWRRERAHVSSGGQDQVGACQHAWRSAWRGLICA